MWSNAKNTRMEAMEKIQIEEMQKNILRLLMALERNAGWFLAFSNESCKFSLQFEV